MWLYRSNSDGCHGAHRGVPRREREGTVANSCTANFTISFKANQGSFSIWVEFCDWLDSHLAGGSGIESILHVLNSSEWRQKAHHLITVSSGSGATDACLAVCTGSGDWRVADSSWNLVCCTIWWCTASDLSILVDSYHANCVMALFFIEWICMLLWFLHVVWFFGLHPGRPDVGTSLGRECLLLKALRQGKLCGLITDEESVIGLLHDFSCDWDGVLNPSQSTNSAYIHGSAIHNHGIEGCFTILVGRATKTHCAIATALQVH